MLFSLRAAPACKSRSMFGDSCTKHPDFYKTRKLLCRSRGERTEIEVPPKTIVIITDRQRIASKIESDLHQVLTNHVRTMTLTFEEAEQLSELKGDLFLFTLGNRIEWVKEKIQNPEDILVVTRTFQEQALVKILEIPKNTKVLVVNDNYENTLQTISLLYDLNFDNILMSPYKENEYDTTINVAITPGESDKVPSHISRIIDIGDRCLDLATFMEIIYRLQISDNDISARLLNYSACLINSNEGITRNYKDTVMRSIQLERVMDMTEQGVAMTLKDGEIILCNKKFKQLVAYPVHEGKTRLQDILDKSVLDAIQGQNKEDCLIKLHGRDILLTQNRIIYQQDIYQDIYFFEDMTYVKSLEETVSNRMKVQGFVAKYTVDDLIYRSQAMEKCIRTARIFANTEKTILITGQSGTGKELLAQSIHNLSERRLQPFVAINCAAMPASLLESELFGYEKGAFTGASREGKIGLFEHANNGTIFLDEIGDMPFEMQSRLLRVIQERQIMRVGGLRVKNVNVRIICATNRDLLKEVRCGRFREDLYYRISVLPIRIPTLNQRREDILPIFRSFLPNGGASLTAKEESSLLNYDWPGNVRELQNAAEYYMLMSGTDESLPQHIIGSVSQEKQDDETALLLRAIQSAWFENGGIGREALLTLLNEMYGADISLYRLRVLLEQLRQQGRIVIRRGRQGIIPAKEFRESEMAE